MEKWILCKHKGYVINIIAPKTSNKYRFHIKRPLLIKNKEDIEYFLSQDYFVESKAPIVKTDKLEPEEVTDSETNDDTTADSTGDANQDNKIYSKEELKDLKKSELRAVFKDKLPEKDCPTKSENIIKSILEAQGAK